MHSTAAVVGIIPARLASTRLARKALRPIAGVPMIARVYQGARACGRLRQVLVATDADEIAAYCRQAAIPIAMTSSAHASGTDRIGEVLAASPEIEAVVNIQGDEPMVRAEMLDALLDALFAAPDIEVATLSTPLAAAEADAPNIVKVVLDRRGRALYFSRAPIPYPREGPPLYRKHLGYYAYSRRALDAFRAWPAGALETAERLEQLRFLENGWPIAVAETPFDSIGVDTAEDLARVERHFARD
ncbi:MAG: 3-deoxy-manno-octulosonate cytidylyltransferase [Terriglobales bacterium]